jgi:hypothetical protein
LCCVCCKDGNMERKVTWRTKGFKQYKNGSKGKKPRTDKKKTPGAWMSVCCECCVLSGRGICDELITRPEESYRLWCVLKCDREASTKRGGPGPYIGLSSHRKKIICICIVIICLIRYNQIIVSVRRLTYFLYSSILTRITIFKIKPFTFLFDQTFLKPTNAHFLFIIQYNFVQ